MTAYDVSLEKGEADVTYDPARTDPKKIAASVSETGFAASIEGADESPNGSSTVTTQGPTVKSGNVWDAETVVPAERTESACVTSTAFSRVDWHHG